MAKFVDYNTKEQGINFTGRSQGFTSPLEVIGKGLQGFAQTASLFQKNQKAGEDDALKNEISNINQNLQDAQINELQTNPPGMDQGLSKIKRLGTAYNRGGDTDTWGKLNLAVKELKKKHPDRVADIDAYTSSIVKSSMANDYRSGLSAQRDAALKAEQDAASDTEKYWRAWAGTNQEDIVAAGIDPKSIDVSNEKQMRTIQTHVATIQADAKSIERSKAALALEKEAGNDPVSKAKKLATKEVSNKTTQFLKAANPVYNEFIQSKDLALKDGRITPEEATELRQTWTAVRTQLKSEVTSLVNGQDYATILTNKNDRDDIIAVADSQMQVIDDMLANQNWGLLGETLRQTTSKYEARELETLEGKYGSYASSLQHGLKNGLTLEAIDAAYSDLMGGPAKLLEAKQDYARRFLLGGMSTGKVDNLGEGLGAAVEDGAKPEEIKRTLSDVQRVLTDPNQDPAVVSNVAKSVFQSGSSDVLLKQFNDKSKRQVFTLLSDKRVGERLKGTPEYTLYENWVKDQFTELNRQNVDTLVENQAILGTDVSILFDPKTNTFKVTEDPRFQKPLGDSIFINPRTGANNQMAIEALNASKIKSAVVSMNADLLKITDVISNGESGLDPTEEVKLLLDLAGMRKLPPVLRDAIMETPEEGEQIKEPAPVSSTPASPILNLVGKAEGADYNTIFGGSKKNLSSKTVAQILQDQKIQSKVKGSSATGKFQVMRATLNDLVEQGVVSLEEKFTPQLQERIAHALLEKRGYSEFINGELSAEEFSTNLSKEWASIPVTKRMKGAFRIVNPGESYYAGDGKNKATISVEELQEMINGLIQ